MLDVIFSSMIKQVHNSLTVHDSSRALKFDDFFEFRNLISDRPPPPPPPSIIMMHCVRKSIRDSLLSYKMTVAYLKKNHKEGQALILAC